MIWMFHYSKKALVHWVELPLMTQKVTVSIYTHKMCLFSDFCSDTADMRSQEEEEEKEDSFYGENGIQCVEDGIDLCRFTHTHTQTYTHKHTHKHTQTHSYTQTHTHKLLSLKGVKPSNRSLKHVRTWKNVPTKTERAEHAHRDMTHFLLSLSNSVHWLEVKGQGHVTPPLWVCSLGLFEGISSSFDQLWPGVITCQRSKVTVTLYKSGKYIYI